MKRTIHKLSEQQVSEAVKMYENGSGLVQISKHFGVCVTKIWTSIRTLTKMRGSSHRQKHGYFGTRTWLAWKNMKSRCSDRNGKDWYRYGGRGISVCERWKDFKSFLEDMGESPGKGWSLDRINNDGNYEPGNCRWATWKQQRRNESHIRLITADGITMCLSDWCQRLGGSSQIVASRIKLGWSEYKAVTTPKMRCSRLSDNV